MIVKWEWECVHIYVYLCVWECVRERFEGCVWGGWSGGGGGGWGVGGGGVGGLEQYSTWHVHCPACRTSLIATRFWVVMICPIIKCLTVLRVFFYLVWFVFIHHNFQFYFELCTYCNILDIYLSQNLNFVNYLLFYMKLLNYLFFNMFRSVLECCELTGVSLLWPWLIKWK